MFIRFLSPKKKIIKVPENIEMDTKNLNKILNDFKT